MWCIIGKALNKVVVLYPKFITTGYIILIFNIMITA